MRKVYKIQQNEQHTCFHLDENVTVVPANQMIADSDTCTFIYIVEENGQYSYLAFEPSTWESLIPYIEANENPKVKIGDTALELTDFVEELQSLLFNIEGNSNYGEQFVEKVETQFAKILQNI